MSRFMLGTCAYSSSIVPKRSLWKVTLSMCWVLIYVCVNTLVSYRIFNAWWAYTSCWYCPRVWSCTASSTWCFCWICTWARLSLWCHSCNLVSNLVMHICTVGVGIGDKVIFSLVMSIEGSNVNVFLRALMLWTIPCYELEKEIFEIVGILLLSLLFQNQFSFERCDQSQNINNKYSWALLCNSSYQSNGLNNPLYFSIDGCGL